MNQRYFRCIAGDALYEHVRLSLDDAWGHVAPVTCISAASRAPKDSHGRIVLAVWDFFCEYEAVLPILPELLGSGAVEEIDAETYMAVVNPVDQ